MYNHVLSFELILTSNETKFLYLFILRSVYKIMCQIFTRTIQYLMQWFSISTVTYILKGELK